MATTLLHKRSATPGAVPLPEQLTPGELAVNLADKKWFTKKSDGTVVCLNRLVVIDGGEIIATTYWLSSHLDEAITTHDDKYISVVRPAP